MLKIESITGTVIQTNNYIISDNNKIVLVEASAKLEDIKNIVKNNKVEAILLTHGHWDHFLNLQKYLETFTCKVYMTKEAFKKTNLQEKTFYADNNPKLKLSSEDIVFIKDKDVLNFGENLIFKVIETKGHTNCSVCYLLNNENLFSGDTLFKNDFGRYDLPTGDYSELKESLEQLIKLDPKIKVYPGHGEFTSIEEESEILNLL
jgi:glyoxylase-like metal-dependent hydrolase (beta-lactamase superfamily II)